MSGDREYKRRVRVRLLGPLEVEGVEPRDLGSRKARTLVKVLALAGGAPVEADRIVDVLWGDDPPARPAEQIGVLVSRLRSVLDIERSDAGWSLAVEWLDVAELDARVDEAARATSPTVALAAARAALALVRGDLLADERDPWWATTERAAVARTVARARVLAADAALAAGQPADAAAEAERALDHDPYDEAALRALMRAHAAGGKPASALAAYARARERLAEDLGVDPTRETEDLHTSILLAPDAPTRPHALVGRDRELAALDRATGGVVIEGEAGIGKTALLDAWLATRPALRGRCDELGRELPLQPILDALSSHLDAADLDVVGVADTAAGRAALFENLLAVARRTGSVLAVEDIHLAGPSTLEWLAFAIRRGLHVMVTTRSTTLPGAEVVHVGPLDLDAAIAIVGERGAELHARSGGNPLFLVELANAGDGELPASVRDAVAARVDALGDAATTLRSAAVLGTDVDVDLLAGMLAVPVPALLEHIDAGVRARVIDESLTFRHELVREALVAGTNVARRAFVHREAARVLRARPHHDALDVAFHAQRGGDVDLASAALVEAADIATDRYDSAEAERLLDRAIELADTPTARAARARLRIGRWDIAGAREDARAAGALDLLAWAEYYGRDYELALRYADEAIERASTDADRASCLAMSGRVLHARGALHDAEARLTRAVASAPPDVRGYARMWLASLRNHRGDPDEAVDLVERALVDGRWLGHPFAAHHGRFARTLALGQRGRIADALAAIDDAQRAARDASGPGDRFVHANENARTWLLRAVGRIDEADEISHHIFESTDTPPAMEMHCAAALDLLDARLLVGDLDGAATAIERSRVVDTFNGTMAWHQKQRYATLQARFALASGDRERATELATSVVDDATARGAARYEVLARAVLGELDPRLDHVAGLEAWIVTAQLGRWPDADRRAARLIGTAGPHAEALRSWVASRFSALGR